MDKLLAFLTKNDWLGHVVEAAVMTGIVAALSAVPFILTGHAFNPWGLLLIGGAFATGHFHGREKRDCEVRLRMTPPHLDGYKFWLWNKDELTDFFPVLAVYLAYFAFCLYMTFWS